MVNEILNPKSIVVVGGSNDVQKPGGRILMNLINGKFAGELFVVNPKEDVIQGIECFKSVQDLPEKVDLAIIAIAAKFCPATIEELAANHSSKAFIILSAGFSEIGDEGKAIEDEVVAIVNKHNGTLIGPNCIGVLTPNYQGVFAGPLPKLDPKGCDFVTGSGATACFILELAIPRGLTFASVFSVGNSAQTGVEDVLEHWDNSFDAQTSSLVKILYLEKISNPKKFLQHSKSLIAKGCRIAAIKSGTTDAGSRAVSSHTGALAGSDLAVEALFNKAGVIRCHGRTELVDVANVLLHKPLAGNRIAVITHAGGPGVMLTDTLDKNKMQVPHIEGPNADELLGKLFHGSSVANPIDFLATGSAEHLSDILDFVDSKFDNIDGAAVIFGTTGMFDSAPVYDALDKKMKSCKKPIFPVLPSIVLTEEATNSFIAKGRSIFIDEVHLGEALAKVWNAPKAISGCAADNVDSAKIRKIIDNAADGYLSPSHVQELLDAVAIPRAKELESSDLDEALSFAKTIGFPIVAKVVGPVHKSDVGGVIIGIKDEAGLIEAFAKLMNIESASGVLIQQMLSGMEIFIGAKREEDFGHLILCGLGGIFIEVLKDFSFSLSPVCQEEGLNMVRNLRSYDLIKGVRGKEGANEDMIADSLVKLSALLELAPEIAELDINPLLGTMSHVTAVDARIRIEK